MPSSFLPTDYTVPASESRYLKFKDGDTRFRILSNAIVGNQLWIDHKPIRKTLAEKFTRAELDAADLDPDGNKSVPKHFMAFAVLHEGNVKILQVDQITIQREIERLYRDEDWGDPTGYDILVTREKKGGKTAYSVISKPHKPLTGDQMDVWDNTVSEGFDINALFSGADPFAASEPSSRKEPKSKEVDTEEVSSEDEKSVSDDLDSAGF